jgi:UDP-N-acetylglucosamine acyltransferase
MTQNIHPTAYIAEQAILGKNITVGPFAVIESPAQIGDNCKIGAHAVVKPRLDLMASHCFK